MSYQQGCLRQVKRKEGVVWYFRYRTEKNGKRVENTKRVGLVSELKTESAAWKKVDEMGMRAEINTDTTEAVTFGVLALRYLDAETRDDAVVHYVKKVMIPAWGNTVADDIKRKDVRDWLARSAVAATVNTRVKYSVSVMDFRIMSVCSGVTVIALYSDFTPLRRQPLHGFEEQTSSNIPYS